MYVCKEPYKVVYGFCISYADPTNLLQTIRIPGTKHNSPKYPPPHTHTYLPKYLRAYSARRVFNDRR